MKRDEIIEHLKQRILSGKLAPGSFLPLRPELIEYCEASNVTVQRAVNRLTEEGFLTSCGSRGIMVSKTPPHRCRFGILVPPENRSEDIDNDTRWASIREAMRGIEESHENHHFVRYAIDANNQPQEAEFQRLRHDLANSLIAGVIVTYSMNSELLTQLDGYPVVLHQPRDKGLIRAVALGYNWPALAALAVEELKRRGATKIALVMNAEIAPDQCAKVEEVLLASGVETRREWIHAISRTTRAAVWAGRLIELLYLPGMPKVPDGLIVLNENLFPHVLEALGGLGKTVGRDVHLCSHCNLPAGRPLPANVAHAAFDSRKIMLDSMKYLKNFNQLNEEVFNHETFIAPVAVRRPGEKIVESATIRITP